MARVRLEYRDYRPLRPGDKDYSPTSRRMYSPSLDNTISRREFNSQATRIPTSTSKPEKTSVKKPRKQRVDKGVTRKDYVELVRPQLQAMKQAPKHSQIANVEQGRDRLSTMMRRYEEKTNKQAETSQDFWNLYEIVKHPTDYTADEFLYVDNFFSTNDEGDVDFDIPWGMTP